MRVNQWRVRKLILRLDRWFNTSRLILVTPAIALTRPILRLTSLQTALRLLIRDLPWLMETTLQTSKVLVLALVARLRLWLWRCRWWREGLALLIAFLEARFLLALIAARLMICRGTGDKAFLQTLLVVSALGARLDDWRRRRWWRLPVRVRGMPAALVALDVALGTVPARDLGCGDDGLLATALFRSLIALVADWLRWLERLLASALLRRFVALVADRLGWEWLLATTFGALLLALVTLRRWW